MQLFINYLFFSTEKKLRLGLLSSSGRNFTGRICVYHKGGGNKKCNYSVDFFRRINSIGFVVKIVKTSLFTSYLGLILYQNGISSYILLSEEVNKYQKLFSGTLLPLNFSVLNKGTAVPLFYIKLFASISNMELFPFTGSSLVRAAGASAIVTAKFRDLVSVKLRSGWNVLLSNNCISSIGSVSNSLHKFQNLKKAGKVRALGIRPTVRGVAMNPCDHPHGGGEGKKSPPVGARSPWGWLTKGTPTNVKKFQISYKKKFKNIR
jgi:large subunit ribosomal protein L2